jgi:hypothetical protein
MGLPKLIEARSLPWVWGAIRWAMVVSGVCAEMVMGLKMKKEIKKEYKRTKRMKDSKIPTRQVLGKKI